MKTNKSNKKNSFMKNVLILICSQFLIKVLGLIYKLVITNIEGFGDVGVGYYSAGYQIYALLLTLSSIGIPSVISKLVSERLAIDDKVGAQRIFKVALKFFAALGLIFSVGLYVGADFIANNILNVPDVSYVMKVLAPAIVFVSISAVLRGYFAGHQNMKPTSVSQTLEQFLNCILSITFVYACIGKDAYIMAAAGNLSTTLAIVITFVYLIMYYKNNKIKVEGEQNESPERGKTTGQLLKTILAISIPITIGSIISVISTVIDTATVSNCIQYAYRDAGMTKEALEQLAMKMTGILSKIDTLITFPIAINIAFSTALVPAVSESIARKDYKTAANRLSFSFFASVLIILPCAAGFISLAEPILKMIYPAASDGALILQISSISMVFIALSQTINGGLYGLNKQAVPAIALAIGIAIKFVLNLILVSNPKINIAGASISSVICQVLVFAICFKVLVNNLKLDIKLGKCVLKPIIASLVMGMVVFITQYYLKMQIGNTIATLVSIVIGIIVYAVEIIGMKILSKEDMYMLPYGMKLYSFLEKLGIYKEKKEPLN